jgi:hypothetical protein
MPLEENCLKDDTHTKEPLRASDRPARASLPPSLRAGMSLEAAIAVPLFLFFVMNLLFVFDSIRLQSGLQAALQQAGEQICEAAYYTRYGNGDGAAADIAEQSGAASFVFSETFIRSKVTAYLGNAFWQHTCVAGGRAGLSFAGSRIMTEGDRVEIVVNYRIRPFIRVAAIPDFPMQSRYCGHAWVGWTPGSGLPADSDASDRSAVYVTRYGEVFHRDPDCIYLNPQIRAVPASRISGLRSGDGSKYYPCECCRPGKSNIVYLTKEGNRYHSDRSCSGIVRHISKMNSAEAGDHYRPCSACGDTH